jgi:thioredoxin-related protein
MRTLLSIIFAMAVLVIAGEASRAALDGAPANGTRLELLVFEHADCTYCRVFRRDVVPRYQRSTQATEAPMRFVDIERTDLDQLLLKSRINMLPTAVLMKGGREVDRITGYWSPDDFFKMLAYIILKAE